MVERVRPEIDGGRFPIKRTPGESVEVTATIFADGYDVLAAVLRDRSGTAEAAPHRDAGHGFSRAVSKATADHAEHAEQNFSAIAASSAVHRGQGRQTDAAPSDTDVGRGFSRAEWRETPTALDANRHRPLDRAFVVDAVGWHEYEVVAWIDRFLTWRRDLKIKAATSRSTTSSRGADSADRDPQTHRRLTRW